jgi:hypothetical protein
MFNENVEIDIVMFGDRINLKLTELSVSSTITSFVTSVSNESESLSASKLTNCQCPDLIALYS